MFFPACYFCCSFDSFTLLSNPSIPFSFIHLFPQSHSFFLLSQTNMMLPDVYTLSRCPWWLLQPFFHSATVHMIVNCILWGLTLRAPNRLLRRRKSHLTKKEKQMMYHLILFSSLTVTWLHSCSSFSLPFHLCIPSITIQYHLCCMFTVPSLWSRNISFAHIIFFMK